MMLRRSAKTALLVLLIHAVVVSAQKPASITPESLGMSTARLARITQVMDEYSKARLVAGTVTLVARGGRVVYHEAAGFRDIEAGAPMQRETLFRIASQTKALTSVGIMMLVEEGKLLLTDPVAKYIPAFDKTTVLSPGTGGTPVPAKRRITIRDLLTHTAGVSYGGEPAVAEQYKSAGFTAWYFADRSEPIGHWIEKLGALPFVAQPGERFVYGYSTDILGYVIERVSGQPLDRFLKTRLIDPLKMVDTDFFVPVHKAARLATVYARSGEALTRAPDGHPGQGHYVTGPRAAFAGGAGLVSTASDYARFLQMLLNGGELDGVRLLSPRTVALMTSDHLGEKYGVPGRGFGLGFETVTDLGLSGRYGSEGEYSWGGAYFSRYWVDPAEEIVTVFLSQLLPSGGVDLQEKLRVLVNQAIIGPIPAPADGRHRVSSR
jgi:CubicO group peptidase (beta-lactamase class C family)